MTRRNLFALLLAPLAGLAGKAWPGRKASLVVLDVPPLPPVDLDHRIGPPAVEYATGFGVEQPLGIVRPQHASCRCADPYDAMMEAMMEAARRRLDRQFLEGE